MKNCMRNKSKSKRKKRTRQNFVINNKIEDFLSDYDVADARNAMKEYNHTLIYQTGKKGRQLSIKFCNNWRRKKCDKKAGPQRFLFCN